MLSKINKVTGKLRLWVVLLFLVPVMAFAQGQDKSAEDSKSSYDGFMKLAHYHGDLAKTIADIQGAKDGNVDWKGISDKFGFPEGMLGQDILARLQQMEAIVSEYVEQVKKEAYENGNGSENSLERHFIVGEGAYEGNIKPVQDDVWNRMYGIKNARPPNYEPPKKGGGGLDDDGFYGNVSHMLEQLNKQIPQLIRFIVALSYVCGFFLFATGVMKLKAYGQQTIMSSSQANFAGPLAYMTIGTLMVFFPSIIDVGTATVFGPTGGDAIYSYNGSLSGLGFAGIATILFGVIKLIGFIAFCKGWLILVKLGSNHGQTGVVSKGLIHIVAGVFAINIMTSWEVLRATFGYVF